MTTVRKLVVAKALRALVETATGKPCGLGDVPTAAPAGGGAAQAAEPPFSILYSIPGGGYSGDYGDPNSTRALVFQVTTVGARPDQAMWLADRVGEAVLGRNPDGSWLHELAIAGYAVVTRESDSDGGGDGGGASMSSEAPRYIIVVTPWEAQ